MKTLNRTGRAAAVERQTELPDLPAVRAEFRACIRLRPAVTTREEAQDLTAEVFHQRWLPSAVFKGAPHLAAGIAAKVLSGYWRSSAGGLIKEPNSQMLAVELNVRDAADWSNYSPVNVWWFCSGS